MMTLSVMMINHFSFRWKQTLIVLYLQGNHIRTFFSCSWLYCNDENKDSRRNRDNSEWENEIKEWTWASFRKWQDDDDDRNPGDEYGLMFKEKSMKEVLKHTQGVKEVSINVIWRKKVNLRKLKSSEEQVDEWRHVTSHSSKSCPLN